jgi:hypothetical protein
MGESTHHQQFLFFFASVGGFQNQGRWRLQRLPREKRERPGVRRPKPPRLDPTTRKKKKLRRVDIVESCRDSFSPFARWRRVGPFRRFFRRRKCRAGAPPHPHPLRRGRLCFGRKWERRTKRKRCEKKLGRKRQKHGVLMLFCSRGQENVDDVFFTTSDSECSQQQQLRQVPREAPPPMGAAVTRQSAHSDVTPPPLFLSAAGVAIKTLFSSSF